MSSVYVDGALTVYGGGAEDRVWRLCLEDASHEWHELRTHGDVPPARRHFSLCEYRGRMMLYGGKPLDAAAEGEPEPLYSLCTRTGRWTQVHTTGDHPGPRTHHTTVVVDNLLLLFGGRTLSEAPTVADVQADKRRGFYDVYVLDLQQLLWHRVERYDPNAPMLWGHGASVFRNFMVVTGGFEVSAPPPTGLLQDASAQPSAMLNDAVFVFDIERCEWRKASPHPRHEAPLPRALHSSHTMGGEVLIYGGITVGNEGRTSNVMDAWLWDIASGGWRRFPFAVSYWTGQRPLSAVLSPEGSIAVASNQTEVHYFDFTRRTEGWKTVSCDPSRLYAPSPPAQPELPPPVAPTPEVVPEVMYLPPPVPEVVYLPPVAVRPATPPPDPRIAERRRQREQQERQEKEQRDLKVRMLQEHIQGMRDQLAGMSGLHGQMMQERREEDCIKMSPPRQSPGAPHPATLADTRAQDDTHHYLHNLQHQLADLQKRSQEATDDMYDIHKKEMDEAKSLHTERVGMIVSEQEEQLKAQQVLATQLMEVQKAEMLRNQLELLRQQQKKLADLTRVAPPVPQRITPDARHEIPAAIHNMEDAISKLRTATSRPFQSTVPPRPPGVRDMETALERLQGSRDAMPFRSAEEMRDQHLAGLREHLVGIHQRESSMPRGPKQVSPVRGRSFAVVSPYAHNG